MTKPTLALLALFICASIGAAQAGKSSTAQERKDLFQLVSQDAEVSDVLKTFEGGAAKMATFLKVKKTDINGDKKSEYIVILEEPGLCGAHFNCPNWVYQRSGGSYALLLRTLGESLSLEKTSTNKFRDLRSSGSNSAVEEGITIYKFDGTTYKPSKCYTSVCEPGKKCRIVPGKCEAGS